MEGGTSEGVFSIFVTMNRMLLSFDVFVMRIFIFLGVPSKETAIGGTSFLSSVLLSDLRLSAVVHLLLCLVIPVLHYQTAQQSWNDFHL